MTRPFGGSIARTLTVLTSLVSGVALLLACAAFALYDRATSRESAVRNLAVQAQIVGSNSVSALVFNDPHTAEDTLAALRAAPSIVSSDIYTRDGRPFAHYQRDGTAVQLATEALPTGNPEMVTFEANRLILVRRILFQGAPIGSVAIRSDLTELDARRGQYVGLIAIVLLVSFLAAVLLSWRSQRAISEPIASLAGLARKVADERDYAIRAPMSSPTDEIAILSGAFNTMLGQIQEQDHSLRVAQQELETRVQQRTAELQAVNAELEAFSYSVSHDLRAPLRHVTGFANLLEERAKDRLDAQCIRYLQTISEAAKRMGQLIDDLLAFSRIGRGQLTRRTVRLDEIFREARDEVSISAAGRELEWRIAELPSVEGDPALLRLVMINLLSNAVKYTAPRDHACIEIGVLDGTENEVVIFVRDNGVGFDMKYANKLFGVFQRLHSTDEFEGTGIGLANVRRIVHRHGGRAWAEAELDRGATFFFSLPMKGPAA